MRKPEGLACLYLDFDSFFASAEQMFQPRLQGRPVGVVPVESRHTCVIAASREAKPYGVKTGTGVTEARQLCPQIVFVLARHDRYVKLHHDILAVLEDIVPVQSVRSIDEMCFKLLRNESVRAVEIAHQIKRDLRKKFGPALTCSIGLAANDLLAKIAAEMNKPNGLIALPTESLPGAIAHLKLTDIPGISHGNEARLKNAGISTIERLWALAPKQARALWGTVEGERFWSNFHGYVAERPSTERCMFGHSRVLSWNWRDYEHVRICARLLTVKAARRMRREGFAAKYFTLTLRCKDAPGFSSDHRFVTPVRDDHSAMDALGSMLKLGFKALRQARPKMVHVYFHGLVEADKRSFDLFENPEQARLRNRWEAISDLTDQLITRHHKRILNLGPYKEPPGGYAGGKIAFNRVPELSDF